MLLKERRCDGMRIANSALVGAAYGTVMLLSSMDRELCDRR
jgi:hypothetical protein